MENYSRFRASETDIKRPIRGRGVGYIHSRESVNANHRSNRPDGKKYNVEHPLGHLNRNH